MVCALEMNGVSPSAYSKFVTFKDGADPARRAARARDKIDHALPARHKGALALVRHEVRLSRYPDLEAQLP
jgi:hypothetical protein